jgi:hypothetical protein
MYEKIALALVARVRSAKSRCEVDLPENYKDPVWHTHDYRQPMTSRFRLGKIEDFDAYMTRWLTLHARCKQGVE